MSKSRGLLNLEFLVIIMLYLSFSAFLAKFFMNFSEVLDKNNFKTAKRAITEISSILKDVEYTFRVYLPPKCTLSCRGKCKLDCGRYEGEVSVGGFGNFSGCIALSGRGGEINAESCSGG